MNLHVYNQILTLYRPQDEFHSASLALEFIVELVHVYDVWPFETMKMRLATLV